MIDRTAVLALIAVGVAGTASAASPLTPAHSRSGAIPLESMTIDEVVRAGAAGTGCTWLGGSGSSRMVAIKEDRGAVKRGGIIIALRPAAGSKEMFPYTYRRWNGGGMAIAIEDSGKEIGRGPEHVETVATLRLAEKGRSQSWRGRLNCGS
jgi:hypothetical protein